MHTPASTRRALLCGTIALLAAAQAGAQERVPIKLGLWEVQQSGDVNGRAMPDMNDRLARLPPEQRKRMEAMMRERGVQMPGEGTQGMKICLDEASVDPKAWASQHPGCETKITSRGEVWAWKGSCTQPPSQSEGETRFSGQTGYVTKMTVITQHQGQAQTMHMTHTGKWLGADCGAIKPVSPRMLPARPVPPPR